MRQSPAPIGSDSSAVVRDIVDLLPDAFAVLDMDGCITHANRRFTLLVEREGAGIPFRDLTIDPDHADELVRRWQGSGTFRPGAVEIRLDDGDTRRMRCDGARIRAVPLVLLRIRDKQTSVEQFTEVTHKVEAHNLREMKRRLESSLDELEAANARLERSNAELDRYAAVVSHDLRTPLATITGYAELLLVDHTDGLDEEGAEAVRAIRRNAERMEKVIRALLELARLDTDALDQKPVDSARALRAAIEQLAGEASELVLTTGEMLTVNVDPTHLTQLFQNLVGNAVKFRAPSRPPRVQVTSRHRGSMAEFTVADNGMGVPADEREEIFELLRRGSAARNLSGNGLGLATCRKIVEAYGGQIRCEPQPDGPGTAFIFTLPVGSLGSGSG